MTSKPLCFDIVKPESIFFLVLICTNLSASLRSVFASFFNRTLTTMRKHKVKLLIALTVIEMWVLYNNF